MDHTESDADEPAVAEDPNPSGWWRQARDWLRRLPPGGSLVVLGVAAAAVAFVAALLFALLTRSVLTHGDATSVDQHVNRWVLAHRADGLTEVLRPTTHLGDGRVIAPVTIAAMAILAVRRRWWLVGFLGVTAIATAVLTQAIKAIVGRPRPLPVERLVPVSGAAFPSGHAAQSVACYLAIAVVVSWVSRSSRWSVAAAVGGGAVTLVIGASRVYLGVHWTSDVIAGWALGLATLTATSAALVVWSAVRDGKGPAVLRR